LDDTLRSAKDWLFKWIVGDFYKKARKFFFELDFGTDRKVERVNLQATRLKAVSKKR
jgi:hypothetical protein